MSSLHAACGRPAAKAPAILAYDGSDLAGFAIEQAGLQLTPSCEALVVCCWHACGVGFFPAGGRKIRAAAADEVRRAAEETAAQGAKIAATAGFAVASRAVAATPAWKGLVATAKDQASGLIVIGSHRRRGLLGHMAGSVAAATIYHFEGSVLVVHSSADAPAEGD